MSQGKLFTGKESRFSAERLQNGEDGIIIGFGQSMTPILKSGQPVKVAHLTEDMELRKNDIVFCKVNGHYYLHKILSIRDGRYQIGNNHGHINGWIGREKIFGKVIEIL